jgi:hypothetical protein
MEAFMRRLILLLFLLGGFFTFHSFASAQTDVTLSSVEVNLWPEYDQPSMLVIVDFLASPDTPLPVDLTFRIPLEANLIAVAYATGEGGWINAPFTGPTEVGEWQVLTMPIQQYTMHRFEYYQPLTIAGGQRTYSYLWEGAYAVDEFFVTVLEPLDAISFFMEPAHSSVEQLGALTYYESETVALARGQQYVMNLRYEKTTDRLHRPASQDLQPATPLDESTPGRVSLNNYLPYLIGGIGVFLILGGAFYYWQAGSVPSKQMRRQRSAKAENDTDAAASYCPQCGTRTKPGDRFCRTCGARLRRQEE